MDIVEELRADELPGDRQSKREARMELGKLLDRAADEIERLGEALRPLADLWLYPDDLGEGFSEDTDDAQKEEVFILRSDIRRARAALGEEK